MAHKIAAAVSAATLLGDLLMGQTKHVERAEYRTRTLKLADGRTLSYREHGKKSDDAPSVFYLNGLAGSRLEFFGRPEHTMHVISVDRPGYGASSPHEGRTYKDCARDVLALADHLGLRDFALMGWSTGGPFCLGVMAHLPPSKVLAVSVVASDPPHRDAPWSVFNAGQVAMWLLSRPTFSWLLRPSLWVLSRLALLLLTALRMRSFAERVREAFRQGAAATAHEIVHERGAWDFALEAIPAGHRLHLFHGSRDALVSPRSATYIAGRVKGSRVHIVQGETHMLMQTQWERILRETIQRAAAERQRLRLESAVTASASAAPATSAKL